MSHKPCLKARFSPRRRRYAGRLKSRELHMAHPYTHHPHHCPSGGGVSAYLCRRFGLLCHLARFFPPAVQHLPRNTVHSLPKHRPVSLTGELPYSNTHVGDHRNKPRCAASPGAGRPPRHGSFHIPPRRAGLHHTHSWPGFHRIPQRSSTIHSCTERPSRKRHGLRYHLRGRFSIRFRV